MKNLSTKLKKIFIMYLVSSATILVGMKSSVLLQPKTAIEQLPDEIKYHIISFLITEKNLETAAQNIRSFLKVSKSFVYFLNDNPINKCLIDELASRYTKGDKLATALALHTNGAAQVIQNIIKTDKDAQKRTEKLIEAIKTNNNHTINFLLKGEKFCPISFITIESVYKDLLLIQMIKKQNAPIVKMLIEAGADINKADQYGYTALKYAIGFKTNELILKYLIEAGADINKINPHTNTTALMDAIFWMNVPQVELLIKAGVNVNMKDIFGRTPLRYASLWNNRYKEEIISLLKKAGATL